MITGDYLRMMARYNVWQNGSHMRAAGGLSDAERRQDRGAFFGSIFGTLNHILMGDTSWMNRFQDQPLLKLPNMASSADWTPDWESYKAARAEADARITDWANTVEDAWLLEDQRFVSTTLDIDKMLPRGLCVTHMFNHQTHHRGQVHAMLTAAGADPDVTDLPFMPSDA